MIILMVSRYYLTFLGFGVFFVILKFWRYFAHFRDFGDIWIILEFYFIFFFFGCSFRGFESILIVIAISLGILSF